MRSLLCVAAAALGVVVASPAAAQTVWLADRSLAEGAGIRAGDLELHPGIGGEFGYDSNYFRRAGAINYEPKLTYYRLRISPHLFLSTLSPQRLRPAGGGAAPAQKVIFRAGVYGTYHEFFTTDPAKEQVATDQRRFDLGAGLGVDIAPQGRFGTDLAADYLRVGEPSNNEDPDFAFDRHVLRLGGGATWRPGGGTFSWRLGYDFTGNYFAKDAFDELDNNTHAVSSRARFRFLPRTALLHETRVAFRSYAISRPPRNDSQAITSRLGVGGLVTKRLGFLVSGGWGATFFEPAPGGVEDYDGFIGQAELRYYMLPTPDLEGVTAGQSSVGVGYERSFAGSYLGNFYSRDRGYFDMNVMFAGALATSLRGGFSRYHYPNMFFPDGTPQAAEFDIYRVELQAFAEYRLSDSLGVNGTFTYDANLGDEAIRTTSFNPAEIDVLSYSRYTIFGGIRWFL